MNDLPDHFFRHEYGHLVAVLSRRMGVQHLEAAEDAAQFALATAVEVWSVAAVPDNASAWLYRVAHNHLVGELRQRARHAEIAALHMGHEEVVSAEEPPAFLSGDVQDALLRMLFACCDDALSIESQLVLALKVLCGFDTREISERLFMSEANVYKRLARARNRLREANFDLDELTHDELVSRLSPVQSILYVLFTEGYLSSHADGPIRLEVCDEAIRLTHALAEHPASAVPSTFALLALMHLHKARLPARLDASGGLLLLEEQDRTLLDQREVEMGLMWLARASEGETFSRFHAEAGIAAEHCLAPTFGETRWDRIVACYALLERLAPSALHTLNRAVAVAEWQGAEAGLALLDGLAPPSWLVGSYLWATVLADLNRRAGHLAVAERYRATAIESAPSVAVREMVARRLDRR